MPRGMKYGKCQGKGCGKYSKLTKYKGKHICGSCLREPYPPIDLEAVVWGGMSALAEAQRDDPFKQREDC